jgi:hypothetical protein
MSEAPLANQQEIVDREHLKMLAICYYILGGITIVFSSFGLIHFFIGIFLILFPDVFHGPHGQPDPPPFFIGYLFAFMGGMIVFTGWTIGGLTLYAGRSIQRRTRRIFTLAVAVLNCILCMSMPFGVLLCAFSFVVLTRESVRRLYGS